jgi:hypothetical protein
MPVEKGRIELCGGETPFCIQRRSWRRILRCIVDYSPVLAANDQFLRVVALANLTQAQNGFFCSGVKLGFRRT